MTERDTESPLSEPLRTVTPPYAGRPDTEMDVIGWAIVLVMVVAVLPLAILGGFGWLVWKLITSLFGSEDE